MIINLLHPIVAGFFGAAATIIGAKFFNLINPYWQLLLGIALFSLANYLLYKFKFNSYHLNGSTVTTVVIFASQITFIGFWKFEELTLKWGVGVCLILIGSILLEDKQH